jgi:hypothetical protein
LQQTDFEITTVDAPAAEMREAVMDLASNVQFIELGGKIK